MNPPISLVAGDNAVQLGYIGYVDKLSIGDSQKTGSKILKVEIGSLNGGIVNIESPDLYIAPTLRPAPLKQKISPFSNLVGRHKEVKKALDALPYKQTVEIYGLPRIGKTVLARHLAHHSEIAPIFADGIIYLKTSFGQTAEDILQILFNVFYESKTPLKVAPEVIRDALSDKTALVILDELSLVQKELEYLINVLPSLTFLLAGIEYHAWSDIKTIKLDGLSANDAITLITQKLGHDLSPSERTDAEKICAALDGNPGIILQLISLVEVEGKSLKAIAQQLTTTAAQNVWATILFGSLSKPQRWIIALLGALGSNIALGTKAVAGITGLSEVNAIVETLLKRNLIEVSSNSVRLSCPLPRGLQQQTNLNLWMERTSNYLTQWVQQNQSSPNLILQESEAILRTLEWAKKLGRWLDVISLGRGIEGGLALSGQWGSWEIVLQSVLEAARTTGDQAVEAFALHELGTRSLCLNQLNGAQTYLSQALQIRESLGNQEATEATRHNLELSKAITLTTRQPSKSRPKNLKKKDLRISGWLVGGVVIFSLTMGALFSSTVMPESINSPASRGTQKGSLPEDPTPEDPTPEDLTPEDPTPEDLTPEDPTPEDPTPEDETPQESTTTEFLESFTVISDFGTDSSGSIRTLWDNELIGKLVLSAPAQEDIEIQVVSDYDYFSGLSNPIRISAGQKVAEFQFTSVRNNNPEEVETVIRAKYGSNEYKHHIIIKEVYCVIGRYCW